MTATRLSDLVVPSVFTPYVTERTKVKTDMITSGAVIDSAFLSGLLSGGGLTFNVPFFKDLADTAANVSSDDPTVFSTPLNITTGQIVAPRLSRNQSWSDMDLNEALAGADPLDKIIELVSGYWSRQLMAAFVATWTGVFADNAAAPGGSDTHTINDMTVDVSGVSYLPGTTDFSAEAFIDAQTTMGENDDDLSLVMMHPNVYAKAKKNNLIDFIPDSANPNAAAVPTFLGGRVIRTRQMPVTIGVYETWLFGRGSTAIGRGTPEVPTETIRVPSAGNGGGQETLHSRVEWMISPVGTSYVGTAANGGPSNATSSNNLGAAGSWSRRFAEREQVAAARLITRES